MTPSTNRMPPPRRAGPQLFASPLPRPPTMIGRGAAAAAATTTAAATAAAAARRAAAAGPVPVGPQPVVRLA